MHFLTFFQIGPTVSDTLFVVLLPPLESPGEVISGQHPADILFILNHPGTRSGPIAHSSAREEDNIARDELGGERRMGK